MHVAAVIPSVSRPDALIRVLDALAHQSEPPSQVIVSVPDPSHVPASVHELLDVTVVVSPKGAARQRNTGVQALRSDTDVILFLDDDSVPRQDYVLSVAEVFTSDPEIVALTGRMACDGAADKRELSPAEMAAALEASHEQDSPVQQQPVDELYGCNMAVRYRDAMETPFDERLPLYSWLEDLDLARRLQRRGKVVRDTRCVVAHQGNASGGRTQHQRFGYSSVANPAYLVRKGSLRAPDLVRLIGRPLVRNLSSGLSPKTGGEARARLHGQLLAFSDIARGRFTPERIEEF